MALPSLAALPKGVNIGAPNEAWWESAVRRRMRNVDNDETLADRKPDDIRIPQHGHMRAPANRVGTQPSMTSLPDLSGLRIVGAQDRGGAAHFGQAFPKLSAPSATSV